MADTGVIDAVRQEEFVGKVIEQISGTMTTLLGAVGDRLGLFKNLAAEGPATSAELASRTNLNERYLREWLGGMATAGYLNYDRTTQRFTLPAEHAAVLAHENGPFFVGGMYQMLPAFTGVFDQVLTAFRSGGGVSQSQYNEMMWDGLERFTCTWFENLLLQQWVPAMPDVKAHLERGVAIWQTWDAGAATRSSSWRRRFSGRATWATTTLVRLSPARLRTRAKRAYQIGCVSRNGMSRKGCRRSLM